VEQVDARQYIEAIAAELSRVRGGGLLLSPVDAQLALGWHAAGVPLVTVLEVVRSGERLKARATKRGAGEPTITLSALAAKVEGRASLRAGREAREVTGRTSLGEELRAAASAPGVRARPLWISLAQDAEQLLCESPDAYWTRAIAALLRSLRELTRDERRALGKSLRERLPRRPPGLTNQRFRRALQLQLLNLASALFAVPPSPFLL
jgi:hypothetical protein